MKVITVVNQKGGVGKSTTALALGAGLIKKGFRTLFIDLDAQGNLTHTLGGDRQQGNSLNVIVDSVLVAECIQHTEQGDLLASSRQLVNADKLLDKPGRDIRLKRALEPIDNIYDYCVIDTPPNLGILIVNALTASDGAIIPAKADVYSLQGISELDDTISVVKSYCNPDLKVMGILITCFNRRSIIRREVAEELEKAAPNYSFSTKVYKTKIRECTALVEAQALKQNIFDYAPKSNAAADYMDFVNEFLEEN